MRNIGFPLYVIKQYERGIVERLGRYTRFVEPGAHFQWPFLNMTRVRDVREHTMDIEPQPVITKDNVDPSRRFDLGEARLELRGYSEDLLQY